MRDEILDYANHIARTQRCPCTERKWLKAIENYTNGDDLELTFLLWEYHNTCLREAERIGVDANKLPEVIALKTKLTQLGFQPTCGAD